MTPDTNFPPLTVHCESLSKSNHSFPICFLLKPVSSNVFNHPSNKNLPTVRFFWTWIPTNKHGCWYRILNWLTHLVNPSIYNRRAPWPATTTSRVVFSFSPPEYLYFNLLRIGPLHDPYGLSILLSSFIPLLYLEIWITNGSWEEKHDHIVLEWETGFTTY